MGLSTLLLVSVIGTAFGVNVALGDSVHSSLGTCRFTKRESKVTCGGFTTETELDVALGDSGGLKAKEFYLENSSFLYFPQDIFHNAKFKTISIKNCNILALSDNQTSGFVGLENHLETLIVNATSFVGFWNWNPLKNLTKLWNVTIIYADLEVAPTGWMNVSSAQMKRVELSNGALMWIEDRAFSHFTNLMYLLLNNNHIRILKRNMFPDNLLGIQLENNFLTHLPYNMFYDMPRLKNVVLSGNFINTLNYEVFSGVWGQLSLLDLGGNPMSCDCRLKWALKPKAKPKFVLAHCKRPESFNGKYIMNLNTTELWC